MTERKEATRHPSTMIPESVVQEANYRAYLLRLEPPLTPEESVARSYTTTVGKREVKQNDATRRAAAISQMSLTRDYLRVLVDLGLINRIEEIIL